MENCESCGKLIERGVRLCRACKEKAAGRGKAPALRRVPPPETPAPPPEADDVFQDVPCVRCRKHRAMRDSEFCLACQLELLSLLGEAAQEIFLVPPEPELPVASTVSLMSDLEEKRNRTATSRIRVVGAVKIK